MDEQIKIATLLSEISVAEKELAQAKTEKDGAMAMYFEMQLRARKEELEKLTLKNKE